MLGNLLCRLGWHDLTEYDEREGFPEDFKAGWRPGAIVLFRVCSRCRTPERFERERRAEIEREASGM